MGFLGAVDSYDYAGAVLFNNHAGKLWQRFTNRLRHEIAARAGLTQRGLEESARVSYGKVAEIQKRGAVHFHVVRLDGPEGADRPPPSWASVQLLSDSIRAAVAHAYTTITVPAAAGQPARPLRWGTQLDIRPIRAFDAGTDITEQAVASYATKAAETTGTVDRRVGLGITALPCPVCGLTSGNGCQGEAWGSSWHPLLTVAYRLVGHESGTP